MARKKLRKKLADLNLEAPMEQLTPYPYEQKLTPEAQEERKQILGELEESSRSYGKAFAESKKTAQKETQTYGGNPLPWEEGGEKYSVPLQPDEPIPSYKNIDWSSITTPGCQK